MVSGFWLLACGPWPVVPGLWSLVSGVLAPGLWSLVLLSLVPGLREHEGLLEIIPEKPPNMVKEKEVNFFHLPKKKQYLVEEFETGRSGRKLDEVLEQKNMQQHYRGAGAAVVLHSLRE